MAIGKKERKLPKSLIGYDFSQFQDLLRSRGDESALISASEARLIPAMKKANDELQLASVTLSALRLIREFREKVFAEIGMKRHGRFHYYTELSLNGSDLPNYRLDGVILQVVSGKIKDAVIIEFKGPKASVDSEQIEDYIQFSRKNLGINKIVSVSSEFTSGSKVLPYELDKRLTKNFSVYHLSWSYLKTLANLLLFDNDDNIEDEDQVLLMHEVLEFLEDDNVGLKGYQSMNSDWKQVAADFKNGVQSKDSILRETVYAWHQEQNDMAHILSKHLGVMVKTFSKNKSGNLEKMLDDEIKSLKKSGQLTFDLGIKGSFSDIAVIADFTSNTVSMEVDVTPPLSSETKSRGRLSWMHKQLSKCNSKNPDAFEALANDIYIEVKQKHLRNNVKVSIHDWDEILDRLDKGRDIVEFKISYQKNLRKAFIQPKSFVNETEQMMLNYYAIVVQYLKSWTPPQPRFND